MLSVQERALLDGTERFGCCGLGDGLRLRRSHVSQSLSESVGISHPSAPWGRRSVKSAPGREQNPALPRPVCRRAASPAVSVRRPAPGGLCVAFCFRPLRVSLALSHRLVPPDIPLQSPQTSSLSPGPTDFKVSPWGGCSDDVRHFQQKLPRLLSALLLGRRASSSPLCSDVSCVWGSCPPSGPVGAQDAGCTPQRQDGAAKLVWNAPQTGTSMSSSQRWPLPCPGPACSFLSKGGQP